MNEKHKIHEIEIGCAPILLALLIVGMTVIAVANIVWGRG